MILQHNAVCNIFRPKALNECKTKEKTKMMKLHGNAQKVIQQLDKKRKNIDFSGIE